MLRLIQGFAADDEAMGRDAYFEAGPGQNFLSTAHTLRHYRTANYQPAIIEAGPYETWKEAGSPTQAERATRRWKTMLAEYEPPPMDAAIAEALSEFIARRKAGMSDAWY
jgi:trimethylamine--corrinoid protein Co-methyltransferase